MAHITERARYGEILTATGSYWNEHFVVNTLVDKTGVPMGTSTNPLYTTLSAGDIEIGAVELKNATTDDRAVINRADTARTVATNVLCVQPIDAAGNILTAGSDPVGLKDGTDATSKAIINDANTARNATDNVILTQSIDAAGKVMGRDAANTARTTATLVAPSQDVAADGRVTGTLVGDYLRRYRSSGDDIYEAVGTYVAATQFSFTPPAPIASMTVYPYDIIAVLQRDATSGLWYDVPMSTVQISAAPAPYTVTVTGATFSNVANSIKIRIRGEMRGFSTSANSHSTTEASPLDQKYSGPTSLGAAVAFVTTTWTDLGPEIDVRGRNKIRFFNTVDINNTTGALFRVLLKETSAAAEEYIYKFGTVAAGSVTLDNGAWILGDADGYIEVSVPDLGNTVAYVQCQIYCGAQGATPGTVVTKYIMAY